MVQKSPPENGMYESLKTDQDLDQDQKIDFKADIVWSNVLKLTALHLATIGTLFLRNSFAPSTRTIVFAFIWGYYGGLGITAGAHRLWAHRSYKARFPLRLFLMIGNCIAMQNDIHVWARDHRVHHKFSETDGDPHNSKRGFFFAHMGWLMCKKHPDVLGKGGQVDLNDLLNDPIVRFQKKYFYELCGIFSILIPFLIPVYFFKESVVTSMLVTVLARYCLSLHVTWLVNSAAHFWGTRPYDKSINPRQNVLVSLFTIGEGHHNYHHTFPFDYATNEFLWNLNLTTMFIDFMAWLGLAYDRKKAPIKMVEDRKNRTGEVVH